MPDEKDIQKLVKDIVSLCFILHIADTTQIQVISTFVFTISKLFIHLTCLIDMSLDMLL